MPDAYDALMGDDGEPVEPLLGMIPKNSNIGGFCSVVADTAAVTYTFSLKHVPNTDEPPREVKMSGSSLVEFPMGLHEFAYILPCSKFMSAGAGWEQVLKLPSFSVSRTVATHVHLDAEVLSVPPYELNVGPAGNCTVKFQPFEISSISDADGMLHQRTAFAYIRDLTRRFAWAATERNQRITKFVSKRNSTNGDTLRIAQLAIESAESLVPHELTISNLKYSILADPQFRDEVVSMAAYEKESGLFSTTSTPLPAKENRTVYTILSERLERWNSAMKTIDMEEEPNFRDERMKKTTKPDEQDQNDEELVVQHTFFRAINQASRKRSMLIKCSITLPTYKDIAYKHAGTSDKSYERIVDAFKRVADYLPDSKFDQGFRTPLFQRMRVLLASAEMRELLGAATKKRNYDEQLHFNAFLKRCIDAKLLPLLIEGIVVLKRVRNDDLLKERFARTFDEEIHDSFLAHTGEIEEVFKKLLTGLVPYYQFLQGIDKMMRRTPEDPAWIQHGGTTGSKSLTIKLTASPYGSSSTSIPGPTPLNESDFKGALAAAICRLLFDPSQRVMNLFD